METSANVTSECFPTVYVTNAVDDFLAQDQPCNFEVQDGTGDWQEELEQFWDGSRHRISEFEQSPHLSSSIEKHLLFDECIREPGDEEIEQLKDDLESLNEDKDFIIVKGEDINDIPTQYRVSGFKPHEFIVVGTYVDERVIPGFKYIVRRNQNQERYLFQGKSLRLVQIGQGYGKRLTFESPTLNENYNYFWSDSCADGFGFTIQAVNIEDKFKIFNPELKNFCGQLVVTAIEEDQIEKASIVDEQGRVEKIVSVAFRCNVLLYFNGGNQFLEDVYASGTAVLVKEENSSIAQIDGIKLCDFIADGYELRPYN